nr:hypothetical protein [Tanacetum cinerariifolium]
MTSLFAESHNMVAILEKSDAAEGFKQIIDFLSGSYINHALTVNPHVYISCIKQFWNTAVVKRSGDVTRLQALLDKKRIVITEEVVHEILQLNDAKGVVCLPNEEIFAGLARMGYEKLSTKLTFYKAFFLTQWKFFIHTILHSLSAKRTLWNDFSSAMASALICLSSGQRFNFLKYIFESLVRNVNSSLKFYMYPRFIQLIIQTNIADLSKHTTRYISPVLTQKVFANMQRVGKGFSGVETPLFESMLAVRDVPEEAEAQVPAQGVDVQEHAAEEVATEVVPPTTTSPSPSSLVLDTCSALAHRVKVLENDKVAQHLEIVKLKARVKKLEKINKVKSSKLRRLKKVGTSQRVESSDDVENVFNQGRIVVDMDQDEGIALVVDHEKDAEVEGRHADKQAEIYNIDLDHSSKVLSMQKDDTEVQEAVEVVTTAKLITEVVTAATTQVVAASTPIPAAKPKIPKIAVAPAVSTRRRKRVVIRDPVEELHIDTPAETPTVKDKGKGILIEVPKPIKKKDQVEMDAEYAKKLQEELDKEHEEAYKNIDWNVALDHVQSKEPQYIKRYHGIKKKPQTESEARKNMISYLKNTEGYKMEFFKGKTYDEILPIFQAKFDANMKFLFKSREEMEKEDEEIIKSINETPAQKAAKRRKLTTPLAQKVPVMDYQDSVKVKTVNEDVHIRALVDGNKIIITEASIRRDLQLQDAEGTACLPNAAIFEELARMGTMASAIICLANNQKFNISKYILDNMRKHKSRRKQRKETEVSQDEPQTEEHIPTPSHDPLPSEQIKTNQAAKIEKLKKIVKKLEGKKNKRTHGLKRLYKFGLSARVESSEEEAGLGDQEDASKQGKIAKIDANEDLYLINETAQDQGRINDQDMFGVNDLNGDEVGVHASAGEKEEQSEKVTEKEVSIVDPVTTTGEVVTTADVKVSATLTTTTTTDDDVTVAQTLIEIKAAKPKAATTITVVSTRPKEEGIIMQ